MHANFKLHNTIHKYSYCGNSGGWLCRSASCLKTVPQRETNQMQVCSECMALGKTSSVSTSATRFALKYWAAEILCTRLFQSEQAVDQLMDKLKQTALYTYHSDSTKKIWNLETQKLQLYVQASFLSDSKKKPSRDAL